MSGTDGLSHTPPEDPADASAAASNITPTPQLRLGSKVSLNKDGRHWYGFVLSIDRISEEHDVMVSWTARPAAAHKDDTLGLFKSGQLTWSDGGIWQVDPSTVRAT